MKPIDYLNKELALKNQANKETLEAHVKLVALTKKCKANLEKNFSRQKEDIKNKGYAIFSVKSRVPKHLWDENELKREFEYAIGSRIKTIPGFHNHEHGAKPTSRPLFSEDFKEGKDYTYEIYKITEYVREDKKGIDWKEVQPINK